MSTTTKTHGERLFFKALAIAIGTVLGANMLGSPIWMAFGIFRMPLEEGLAIIGLFTILPIVGISLILPFWRNITNQREATKGH